MANILVVDDKFMDGRALVRQLDELGHGTNHVVSQGQALDAVADGGFDYVFLDLTLPDGDGVEAVPEIRGSGAAVIILLEGPLEELDAEAAGRLESLGEMAYVLKPLNQDEIAAALEKADACRGNSTPQPEAAPAPAAEEKTAAPRPQAEGTEAAESAIGERKLPKRLPKLKSYRDQTEKRYLKRLLKDSKGNVKKAVAIAGISRASYYNLLKKHGLN